MRLRRGVAASQIVVGAFVVGRPQFVAGAAASRGVPLPSWIVRLLGGRMVVQGTALVLRPSNQALTVGATVDVLHATSMLVVAGVSDRHRAVAARSAILALVFAASEMAARR
jgi:hypothetical protein